MHTGTLWRQNPPVGVAMRQLRCLVATGAPPLVSSALSAGLLAPAVFQASRVMRGCVDDLICDGARAVKRVAALSAMCLDAATPEERVSQPPQPAVRWSLRTVTHGAGYRPCTRPKSR